MDRRLSPVLGIGAVVVLCTAAPALGYDCFHFTLGGSSSVILETDAETATLRFVLVDFFPGDGFQSDFEIWFEEGCCNAMGWAGSYGAYVDDYSVQFDSRFVDDYYFERPTCTFCCPAVIRGHFNIQVEEMLPRQTIGTAAVRWLPPWDPQSPLYCDPPHTIYARFTLAESIGCDVTEAQLVFTYTPPCGTEPNSWGTIKALYRPAGE